MTTHTYAGHTLDEIKAAANSITRWPIDAPKTGVERQFMDQIANPATVLAMAARIEELERDRHAARLEGFRLAQDMAASVAMNAPITSNELTYDAKAVSFHASAKIRAMQPPAEWCDMGFPISAPSADWPHPDGFAGGLTEKQK